MDFLTKTVLAVLFVALLVAEWHFSKARIQYRVRENQAHEQNQRPAVPAQHTEITFDIPHEASEATKQKIRESKVGE